MKTPPNKTTFESAPSKRNYISNKFFDAAIWISRFTNVVHPDCALLAALLCLLLWGAL